MAVLFEDTFDGPGFEPEWVVGAGASIVSGRARLDCNSSYNGFVLSDPFSVFANSTWTIEAAAIADGGATGTETDFRLVIDGDNSLWIAVAEGNLRLREEVGGSASVTTVTYDPEQHRWWRIAVDAEGNVLWQTSPNGEEWTTRREKASAIPLDEEAQVRLQTGEWGGGTLEPEYTEFDNLTVEVEVPWEDFKADAEEGDFSDFVNVQAPEGRATVVTDPVAEGTRAYRFELQAGDEEPETGDQRAEAISGRNYFEGEERHFRILCRVDSWDSDVWGLLWQAREDGGTNPPVCLQISGGKLVVSHGDGETIYWEGPAVPEGWFEVVIRVLFKESEGEVEVWLDGVKQAMDNGTGLATKGESFSYDKIGVYRASESDETAVVYHDDYRVTEAFFSEPPGPVATTLPATGITPTKATLNGTVDPNGLATTYHFEYGETEAYGSATPKVEGLEEAAAVQAQIEGLKPGTIYHFRLVAENVEGETAGEDATFATLVAAAARVLSEPVDDTLFIELRHADGSATRLGPDEYEAAGIPQAIDTADGAPGGHRTASFNLVRDPRRDWPDLHLVDDVVIYGRTRPLGRSAFEGQLAHFPSELGDGMSIGVNAVGHQVLLSEDESWRALYVALGFDGWGEAPFVRRERIAEDLGWPQGKISLASDSGGLVWDVPGGQALLDDETTEAHFQLPAGVKAARLGYRGTRRGSWGSMEEAKLRKDDAEDHSGAEEVSLTLDGTARTTSEFTPRRYLALRARVTSENTPGPGRQQAYDRLAVYGDTGIPLREIEDELPGVYAHDVLPHMLDTGAPGLNYRVGANGTIVPNTSFVLPDLAFPDTGKVADGVAKLNAYFLNNYAVWDRKEFHWHPWDPNRLTWRATIAGGAHWSPAGRQAETQLNGMVVSFDDHAGRARLAGPPGSGCDFESELLLDTDRSNPYTRRGRRRWGVLRVDFPLAYGSTAVQIGHVKLLEQQIPQRSGTLVVRPLGEGHVPQLEHPTMGPLPIHSARSGDYVELDGWPEPEPFRIIEKPSYQHESKSLTLQLETASSRMSAIMERVGVSLKGVIGR